jgi:hypothetical protein
MAILPGRAVTWSWPNYKCSAETEEHIIEVSFLFFFFSTNGNATIYISLSGLD